MGLRPVPVESVRERVGGRSRPSRDIVQGVHIVVTQRQAVIGIQVEVHLAEDLVRVCGSCYIAFRVRNLLSVLSLQHAVLLL